MNLVSKLQQEIQTLQENIVKLEYENREIGNISNKRKV